MIPRAHLSRFYVLPLFVTAVALLSVQAHAAELATLRPTYEAKFDMIDPDIEFREGARLGGPGSGVSGLRQDLAYISSPKTSENERHGPHALARLPVAPNAETSFTCCFWYYLEENGPELQVPLNDGSVLYLLKADGFELRVQHLKDPPYGDVFVPGTRGPYLSWRETNRWIFAAFVWTADPHGLSVYQATHVDRVALMRLMTKSQTVASTLPRIDLSARPEVIGNNLKSDRPLAGRMDNLRHFDQALSLDQLEAIRQADLQNLPLPGR